MEANKTFLKSIILSNLLYNFIKNKALNIIMNKIELQLKSH